MLVIIITIITHLLVNIIKWSTDIAFLIAPYKFNILREENEICQKRWKRRRMTKVIFREIANKNIYVSIRIYTHTCM